MKERIYVSENILTKSEILSLSKNDPRWYRTICENCGIQFETHCCRKSTICKKCKCSLTQKELYKNNPNLGKERLEKRTKTNIEKYGVSNAYQRKDIIKKIKNTKKEKYDDENYNNQEKSKETCLKRYGVEYSFQSENNKSKSKKTCLEKYGVEHAMQNEKIKKQALDKWKQNKDEHLEKMKQTMLEKYGVEYAMQCKEIQDKAKKKYFYDGIFFDSSWELAFWIYNIENGNNNIKRPKIFFEYEYNGNIYKYFPDFEIDGKFYEIKGLQFFENKDSSGRMINPFDKSQNDKFEAKHQCMIKNHVNIITNVDKELKYVENKYTKDFLELFDTHLEFPYLNQELSDTSDLGLIHHFHKSIYIATRKGKLSPIEAWKDKDIIKKVALNRLKYVGHCRPSDILQGLNVTRIANKVSVFSPKLAEQLIKKYIPNADIIIDPFSGFSGRMLGSYNCGIHYIGWDINEDHVRESNEIAQYKKIEDMCDIKVQDLIACKDKDWSVLKDICLFTCPPYGGKEHWNENNDEIEKSCDEWIELCMTKHKGCKNYLFVVDKTEKFKDFIVEELTNKSHFGNSKEYVLLF